MTPRLMAETFCFAPAQTLASPSRVRWSSAVDSTIELACTGLAHKARAALSGLSGQRHGRWCRVCAPSSGRRSGPSDAFCAICNANEKCNIYSRNEPVHTCRSLALGWCHVVCRAVAAQAGLRVTSYRI